MAETKPTCAEYIYRRDGTIEQCGKTANYTDDGDRPVCSKHCHDHQRNLKAIRYLRRYEDMHKHLGMFRAVAGHAKEEVV